MGHWVHGNWIYTWIIGYMVIGYMVTVYMNHWVNGTMVNEYNQYMGHFDTWVIGYMGQLSLNTWVIGYMDHWVHGNWIHGTMVTEYMVIGYMVYRHSDTMGVIHGCWDTMVHDNWRLYKCKWSGLVFIEYMGCTHH